MIKQEKEGSSVALEIPKCMGLNPGHSLRGDWSSTCYDDSQTGELSEMRSPIGDLELAQYYSQSVVSGMSMQYK